MLANDLWQIKNDALKTQLSIFLAGLACWMSRRQQEGITYLQAENEILKEQLDTKGQKLKLSNHQRRKLAKQGKLLGRKRLKEYVTSYAQKGSYLRQSE